MRQSDRTRKLLAMLGSNTRGTKVEIMHRPVLANGASETALRSLIVDYVKGLCVHFKRTISRDNVIIPQRLVVADSCKLLANHDRARVRDIFSETFMEVAGGSNMVETNFRANQASSPPRRKCKDVYVLNFSTVTRNKDFVNRELSGVLVDFFVDSPLQSQHAYVPQHTNVMVDIELVEYNPYVLQFLLETGVGIITIIGNKPTDREPLISQRAKKALTDFLGDS